MVRNYPCWPSALLTGALAELLALLPKSVSADPGRGVSQLPRPPVQTSQLCPQSSGQVFVWQPRCPRPGVWMPGNFRPAGRLACNTAPGSFCLLLLLWQTCKQPSRQQERSAGVLLPPAHQFFTPPIPDSCLKLLRQQTRVPEWERWRHNFASSENTLWTVWIRAPLPTLL